MARLVQEEAQAAAGRPPGDGQPAGRGDRFLFPDDLQVTILALDQPERLPALVEGQQPPPQLARRQGPPPGLGRFGQQADGELHHRVEHHRQQQGVGQEPPQALLE